MKDVPIVFEDGLHNNPKHVVLIIKQGWFMKLTSTAGERRMKFDVQFHFPQQEAKLQHNRRHFNM